MRLTAEKERRSRGHARDLEQADLQDVVQSPAHAVAEGKRAERLLRERILLAGPALHIGIVRLLQPPVRICDLDAVERLADVVDAGSRYLCACADRAGMLTEPRRPAHLLRQEERAAARRPHSRRARRRPVLDVGDRSHRCGRRHPDLALRAAPLPAGPGAAAWVQKLSSRFDFARLLVSAPDAEDTIDRVDRPRSLEEERRRVTTRGRLWLS